MATTQNNTEKPAQTPQDPPILNYANFYLSKRQAGVPLGEINAQYHQKILGSGYQEYFPDKRTLESDLVKMGMSSTSAAPLAAEITSAYNNRHAIVNGSTGYGEIYLRHVEDPELRAHLAKIPTIGITESVKIAEGAPIAFTGMGIGSDTTTPYEAIMTLRNDPSARTGNFTLTNTFEQQAYNNTVSTNTMYQVTTGGSYKRKVLDSDIDKFLGFSGIDQKKSYVVDENGVPYMAHVDMTYRQATQRLDLPLLSAWSLPQLTTEFTFSGAAGHVAANITKGLVGGIGMVGLAYDLYTKDYGNLTENKWLDIASNIAPSRNYDAYGSLWDSLPAFGAYLSDSIASVAPGFMATALLSKLGGRQLAPLLFSMSNVSTTLLPVTYSTYVEAMKSGLLNEEQAFKYSLAVGSIAMMTEHVFSRNYINTAIYGYSPELKSVFEKIQKEGIEGIAQRVAAGEKVLGRKLTENEVRAVSMGQATKTAFELSKESAKWTTKAWEKFKNIAFGETIERPTSTVSFLRMGFVNEGREEVFDQIGQDILAGYIKKFTLQDQSNYGVALNRLYYAQELSGKRKEEIIQSSMFKDTTFMEKMHQYLESFVGGAIMGGVMTGISALRHNPVKYYKAFEQLTGMNQLNMMLLRGEVTMEQVMAAGQKFYNVHNFGSFTLDANGNALDKSRSDWKTMTGHHQMWELTRQRINTSYGIFMKEVAPVFKGAKNMESKMGIINNSMKELLQDDELYYQYAMQITAGTIIREEMDLMLEDYRTRIAQSVGGTAASQSGTNSTLPAIYSSSSLPGGVDSLFETGEFKALHAEMMSLVNEMQPNDFFSLRMPFSKAEILHFEKTQLTYTDSNGVTITDRLDMIPDEYKDQAVNNYIEEQKNKYVDEIMNEFKGGLTAMLKNATDPNINSKMFTHADLVLYVLANPQSARYFMLNHLATQVDTYIEDLSDEVYDLNADAAATDTEENSVKTNAYDETVTNDLTVKLSSLNQARIIKKKLETLIKETESKVYDASPVGTATSQAAAPGTTTPNSSFLGFGPPESVTKSVTDLLIDYEKISNQSFGLTNDKYFLDAMHRAYFVKEAQYLNAIINNPNESEVRKQSARLNLEALNSFARDEESKIYSTSKYVEEVRKMKERQAHHLAAYGKRKKYYQELEDPNRLGSFKNMLLTLLGENLDVDMIMIHLIDSMFKYDSPFNLAVYKGLETMLAISKGLPGSSGNPSIDSLMRNLQLSNSNYANFKDDIDTLFFNLSGKIIDIENLLQTDTHLINLNKDQLTVLLNEYKKARQSVKTVFDMLQAPANFNVDELELAVENALPDVYAIMLPFEIQDQNGQPLPDPLNTTPTFAFAIPYNDLQSQYPFLTEDLTENTGTSIERKFPDNVTTFANFEIIARLKEIKNMLLKKYNLTENENEFGLGTKKEKLQLFKSLVSRSNIKNEVQFISDVLQSALNADDLNMLTSIEKYLEGVMSEYEKVLVQVQNSEGRYAISLELKQIIDSLHDKVLKAKEELLEGQNSLINRAENKVTRLREKLDLYVQNATKLKQSVNDPQQSVIKRRIKFYFPGPISDIQQFFLSFASVNDLIAALDLNSVPLDQIEQATTLEEILKILENEILTIIKNQVPQADSMAYNYIVNNIKDFFTQDVQDAFFTGFKSYFDVYIEAKNSEEILQVLQQNSSRNTNWQPINTPSDVFENIDYIIQSTSNSHNLTDDGTIETFINAATMLVEEAKELIKLKLDRLDKGAQDFADKFEVDMQTPKEAALQAFTRPEAGNDFYRELTNLKNKFLHKTNGQFELLSSSDAEQFIDEFSKLNAENTLIELNKARYLAELLPRMANDLESFVRSDVMDTIAPFMRVLYTGDNTKRTITTSKFGFSYPGDFTRPNTRRVKTFNVLSQQNLRYITDRFNFIVNELEELQMFAATLNVSRYDSDNQKFLNTLTGTINSMLQANDYSKFNQITGHLIDAAIEAELKDLITEASTVPPGALDKIAEIYKKYTDILTKIKNAKIDFSTLYDVILAEQKIALVNALANAKVSDASKADITTAIEAAPTIEELQKVLADIVNPFFKNQSTFNYKLTSDEAMTLNEELLKPFYYMLKAITSFEKFHTSTIDVASALMQLKSLYESNSVDLNSGSKSFLSLEQQLQVLMSYIMLNGTSLLNTNVNSLFISSKPATGKTKFILPYLISAIAQTSSNNPIVIYVLKHKDKLTDELVQDLTDALRSIGIQTPVDIQTVTIEELANQKAKIETADLFIADEATQIKPSMFDAISEHIPTVKKLFVGDSYQSNISITEHNISPFYSQNEQTERVSMVLDPRRPLPTSFVVLNQGFRSGLVDQSKMLEEVHKLGYDAQIAQKFAQKYKYTSNTNYSKREGLHYINEIDFFKQIQDHAGSPNTDPEDKIVVLVANLDDATKALTQLGLSNDPTSTKALADKVEVRLIDAYIGNGAKSVYIYMPNLASGANLKELFFTAASRAASLKIKENGIENEYHGYVVVTHGRNTTRTLPTTLPLTRFSPLSPTGNGKLAGVNQRNQDLFTILEALTGTVTATSKLQSSVTQAASKNAIKKVPVSNYISLIC